MTFIEYYELYRFNANNPVNRIRPELIANLEVRRKLAGVKPEDFYEFAAMIVRDHPGAVFDSPVSGKTSEDRWRIANGEKPAPEAIIHETPAPRHPQSGKTVWDVLAEQKAKAEAKAEAIRKRRNPFLPSHKSNADDCDGR